MTRKTTPPGKRGSRNKRYDDQSHDAAMPTNQRTQNGEASADTDKPDKPADYEVGYGKPPQHSKFKPGTSGYPPGRKKRARGRRALFEMISKETVTIREGGRTKKVTREEAFIRHLWARAFADPKGVPPLLIFMRTVGVHMDEDTERELQVTPEHEAIVADFLSRYTAAQDPDDDDEPEPTTRKNGGNKS